MHSCAGGQRALIYEEALQVLPFKLVSVTYLRSSTSRPIMIPTVDDPTNGAHHLTLICLEAFDPARTAFDEPILQRLVVRTVYLPFLSYLAFEILGGWK
ncbi:unnamed protein product [Clonostachys byssicola]|uniref:Uncharacterized protein n=1 Tax=Clonostachys byssicola TaxID=160290 RepID=A0A9N9XZC8_9HYPO|nr:unnamed protein product [Clonostachys byssicola]